MPGAAKEATRKKMYIEDDEKTLLSMKRELKLRNKDHSSLSKSNVRKSLHGGKRNNSLKREAVKKTIVHKNRTSKKQPCLSGHRDKPTAISSKEREKPDHRDVMPRKLSKRRKKRKKKVDLDEASRLQRRTRYLLIKVKLEQNLIDAYSAEGWKGQSKEKIKPEKELQRAEKQILKCKLGIREAIHELDLLSSEGCINNSEVAPDGSVHHEHIICAKCKLREALPDNDIILCDGSCNRAFHQQCLDPPLSTENIPPGDEGWFCKFCRKKMEILEATNAHLGTHFPLDSNWQDVFKEEASLPDGGNYTLCQEEEWPSDDSEDDDYDPDRIEHSSNGSTPRSDSDVSDNSSSFLGSLELSNGSYDKMMKSIGVDSDEINNDEVVCLPRKRASVDYIKLYDEMFGKNAIENEQVSDDEDWGPTKRKRKAKETDDASTLRTLDETDKKKSEVTVSEPKEKQLIKKMKRPIFRLPHNAVEELRLVFAENELPERELRVSLSKQLGLEFDKVNKWFKNARYLALKARKQAEKSQVSQEVSPSINESSSESAKSGHDQIASPNLKIPRSFAQRRNSCLLAHSLKFKKHGKPLLQRADDNQMNMDLGDDVSLKHLREKAKEAKKRLNCKNKSGEREMERLCEIKSRVEKLQQILLRLPCSRFDKSSSSKSADLSIVYVPIAEIKEKR